MHRKRNAPHATRNFQLWREMANARVLCAILLHILDNERRYSISNGETGTRRKGHSPMSLTAFAVYIIRLIFTSLLTPHLGGTYVSPLAHIHARLGSSRCSFYEAHTAKLLSLRTANLFSRELTRTRACATSVTPFLAPYRAFLSPRFYHRNSKISSTRPHEGDR